MKKQLQGIALVLFGILLTQFGELAGRVFLGDYDFLFGLIGVAVGVVGVVKASHRDD